MFRMPVCLMLGIGLVVSPVLAGETSDNDKQSSEARGLAEQVDCLWDVTWQRFHLPKTHLFYDYLSSYEPGQELAHLPTADEGLDFLTKNGPEKRSRSKGPELPLNRWYHYRGQVS